MGKKIGKIFKKVLKVSDTIGLLPEGTTEGLVDQYVGTDLSGKKKQAAQDAADATARNEALLAMLGNQAAAANVDLGLENTPDTQVGGTANAMASTASKRKRNAPGGVAASLGINV